MHYEDIKAALRKRGYTLTRIADELGISRPSVCLAIRPGRRSRPVEKKIAEVLGKTPAQVWPERYGRKGK